jgi:hypothetical protein
VIALYRRHLHRVRASGIDVFVLPTPRPIAGVAFIDDKTGRRHINITGSVHSVFWLFVLLHEERHHLSGHCRVSHVTPYWAHEWEADQAALDRIAVLQPYAYRQCREIVAARFRAIMQPIIDAGEWFYFDETVARWAGCTIPTVEFPK